MLDDERFQVLSEQHPARSNQTKIFLNLIENFPHTRRWSSSSSLINTLASLRRSCIVRPPVAEHQIRLLHRLGCVKAKLLARQIGIPSSSCTPSRGAGCGSSPRPPAFHRNAAPVRLPEPAANWRPAAVAHSPAAPLSRPGPRTHCTLSCTIVFCFKI